ERGYLCSPGKPQELADAMALLLENREMAQCLARAGREWVLSNATWDKRVAEILGHIEELQ
ncbi:MAG: glycosyltransferase, partial [Planctomycetota bacterium]